MKKRAKLTLIIVLLIAVAAASFGILRIHKAGAGSKQAELASEQKEQAEQADLSGDESEHATDELLATVFFASDYQAEEGFDAPADTLRAVLEAAKADGKSIDRAVICGDYTNDAKLHDYQLSPDESIEEIRAIIKEECAGISGESGAGTDESANAEAGADTGTDESAGAEAGVNENADTNAGADESMVVDAGDRILFVQGNHDRMTEQITPSGLLDCGDYLIYVLNTEEDFPWKQGKVPGCLAKVRRSSVAMKECFDELISKGETRPVFIAGHVPLQFTARTSSRHTTGDNLYSSLVFDVVNEAAKDLDIIYLFGHDHSKGWDCYLGGSSVYKTIGDTILIPKFSEEKVNTDVYTEETLNFTYLNAGYVGYYMNCGPEELAAGEKDLYSAADETLTGTVFEIYGDRIVITRYDAGGAHVLGHEGQADPYKGGIDAGLIPETGYSVETPSPQNIYLKNSGS